jgi:hypothetical protein
VVLALIFSLALGPPADITGDASAGSDSTSTGWAVMVIYAHQREVSIGRCTLDSYLIAKASEPEELRDRVIFLPF